MKIKIKNIFAMEEKEILVENLQDDKNVLLSGNPGDQNLMIRCKTKAGFPVYVNVPRGACLLISFEGDNE